MTIEFGFRRTAILASRLALTGGLLFTALLVTAWAWSFRQDRQREAALAAEGCSPHFELTTPVIGVERLGFRRWRVTKALAWGSSREALHPLIDSPDFHAADRDHRRILLSVFSNQFATATGVQQDALLTEIAARTPEPPAPAGPLTARIQAAVGYRWITTDYVVSADRDLLPIEVVRAAQGVIGARDHVRPRAAVIDCVRESREIARSQEGALNHRLVTWWIGQPLFLPLVASAALVSKRALVLATLLSALGLTAIVAAVPWGLFYLLRWMVRGFTRR